MSTTTEITVRAMRGGDEAGVYEVLETALGRRPDPRNVAFFQWKHQANPFGTSPAWVAVDHGRIVGFRTLMRWEFDTAEGPVRAVRAVDTATHPDYQGRGIFSALTRSAIDELRADGVAFVFNTPNDKSRPGYLKMGWREVGRLPVGLRCSPWALARVAGARTSSNIWSTPTGAGIDAREAFADTAATSRLLTRMERTRGLSTHRSADYLQWRYGFEPLAYRFLGAGATLTDGGLVFRLRQRGVATELVVADLLLPEATRAMARRLVTAALRATDADYALGLRATRAHGVTPLPRQGPILTWRALTHSAQPQLEQWQLTLGDIELF